MKNKIKKLLGYCTEYSGEIYFEDVSEAVYSDMLDGGYEGEMLTVYNVDYESDAEPLTYIGCITTDDNGLFFFSPVHDVKLISDMMVKIADFLEALNAERSMN